MVAIKEPAVARRDGPMRFPLQRSEMARLGGAFWLVVGIATLFTLARFSEAFLILRAQALGLPIALTPLVLVVMNVVYALAAYPAGVLSDRFHRLHVLGAGFVLLIGADILLAFAPGLAMVAAGVVLFGLHMGFTQGIFATLIADCAPPDLRGTAFGLFNLLTGGALLAASVIAGGLWDLYGAQATFIAGGSFAAAALAGLFILHRKAPLIGDAKSR
jgi:MFS family permease